jgi:hypothetical protein
MGLSAAQLANVSLIGQTAGAANSAIGAYYGTATERVNMRSRANAADVNARLAELTAQSALAQGQHQAGALSLQAGKLKGAQRAALAANGVDLGVGNAAELQASADIMKQIDLATIEANAVAAAWGHRTDALNFRNEALSLRAGARASNPSRALMTSLLGGASGVARSWYEFDRAGVWKAPVDDRSTMYGR